jgi:hypothetical protein
MSQSPTRKLTTEPQRAMIIDLAQKTGVEVTMPRTARVAGRLIHRLRIEARATNGGHDHPTPSQLELLAELGAEVGKEYAIPKTKKQATARIAQILAARSADVTETDAEQELAVAA